MLTVLLESSVRSLLLGSAVWVILKAARLSDTRTDTAMWTAVLIAALSMPLLSRHVPGLVMTLPHLSASAPPAEIAVRILDAHPATLSGGISTSRAFAWFAHHGQTALTVIYLLGFSACAFRLALGLLLTVGLYRRATPVQAAWGPAYSIRVSGEIRSPASLAGTILLPSGHDQWSAAKRSAVLAHEEAHIARGDFFVQMAAMVHCAIFWFSPFAWWLQMKLAEIAETASDEAAVRRLEDRATYAEILVDVSRGTQKSPLIVAMAKNTFIEQRIEHILSDAPTRSLSLPQRILSVALLSALAIAVAGAKAAIEPPADAPPPATSPPTRGGPVARHPVTTPPKRRGLITRPAGGMHPVQVLQGSQDTPRATGGRNEPPYNPRALLDPLYAPKPTYVPAATIVHAGREFYIRSTEKPVTDVSVTYAMERQIH